MPRPAPLPAPYDQRNMERRVVLTLHGTGTPPPGLAAAELRLWVGLDELRSILDATARAPEVEITFDDGYASDVEVALPELRDRGLRATFFVVSGWVGTPGRLDASALAALAAAGMAIGSHGASHRPWRELSAAELDEEAGSSRRSLAALGLGAIDELALPFGSYDRRALRAARRAGYRRVYSSDGAPAASGDWLVARTTVAAGDGPEAVARALAARGGALRRARLLAKRWR